MDILLKIEGEAGEMAAICLFLRVAKPGISEYHRNALERLALSGSISELLAYLQDLAWLSRRYSPRQEAER